MNIQNSHAGSGYSDNNNPFGKLSLAARTHSVSFEDASYNANVDRLMTLFMNNKATRELAKTVVQYNSAAVMGALAYKANENWQNHAELQTVMPITGHDITQSSPLPQFVDNRENYGESFMTTVLMTTMVAASKADGMIDATEQAQLLKAADQLGFNVVENDFINELMTRDITLAEITQPVTLDKHKSEVYLAAYFAISGENDSGRAFLKDLASAMELEAGLSTYLERQADLGIAK